MVALTRANTIMTEVSVYGEMSEQASYSLKCACTVDGSDSQNVLDHSRRYHMFAFLLSSLRNNRFAEAFSSSVLV